MCGKQRRALPRSPRFDQASPVIARLGTSLFLALFTAGCASTSHTRALQTPEALLSEGRGERRNPIDVAGLPVDLLIETGKASLAQEDPTLAELYFSSAVGKEPESEAALTGLGEAYRTQGRTEAAYAAYERALRSHPDSVSALLGLGRLCRAQGDHGKSLAHLNRALDLEPENPEVLGQLALSYEASEELAVAEPLYRLVAEKTESAGSYNNLGFNLQLQKRHAEAIPFLELAARLSGEDPRTKNNLAIAYAMVGRDAEAFRLFETTVGSAAAHNNLGYLQMVRGSLDEAEQSLSRAMEESPSYYAKAKENMDRLGDAVFEAAKTNLKSFEKESKQ